MAVHLPETFWRIVHFTGNILLQGPAVMKQIMPVLLALIPLAAVVGACVTCP